ncbi:hypothetical protein Patl1_20818 [Pistacia atlantica]|uniref:Uncharacterized protein n=1 Tax=Pistacia atlantica TaxID=434234 RepID=A0ACC1BI98_9ROSI|nr:hypothetical protein Patl1_20818 [Pistacia atlantica]
MIDCDLYDETDAWKNFFKATRETTLYFFTKLRKKSRKGSRVERATGSGTWRTQGDEDLYNGGDRRQHIGYKRSLTFIPKKTEEKGKWVMKEYRLHDSLLRNKKSDLVVCRIKKKVIEEETMRSELTSNNNSGNFVGGELIVSGFHQGMNMGVKPDGLQEVGMMEALEGKESDYIDKNSQGFIMNDLEGTDKAGRISGRLRCQHIGVGKIKSVARSATHLIMSIVVMGGLQIEESGYIINSNQGVTLEEIDMAGSNNQNEHMHVFHVVYNAITMMLGRLKILQDSDLLMRHLLSEHTPVFGQELLSKFTFIMFSPEIECISDLPELLVKLPKPAPLIPEQLLCHLRVLKQQFELKAQSRVHPKNGTDSLDRMRRCDTQCPLAFDMITMTMMVMHHDQTIMIAFGSIIL